MLILSRLLNRDLLCHNLPDGYFYTKVLSCLARKHTAHCAITRLPCTLTGLAQSHLLLQAHITFTPNQHFTA